MQGPDGEIDLRPAVGGSWQKYLKDMGTEGTWGDHVAVVGIAHMLRKDVMIVTSAPNTGQSNITWVCGEPGYDGRPIMLGHHWEHHYVSLHTMPGTVAKSLLILEVVMFFEILTY